LLETNPDYGRNNLAGIIIMDKRLPSHRRIDIAIYRDAGCADAVFVHHGIKPPRERLLSESFS
jgi:hypothetical protein